MKENKVLDRSVAPEIRAVSEIQLGAAEVAELSNGSPLYYLDGGDQEVIQLELVLAGGRMSEEKALTAQLAARLMKEGTKSRAASELAEAIDFLGAHLQVAAGYDTTTLSMVSLKKHLSELLPIVREIITEPAFSAEELSIQKQRSLQQLLVNEEKTDYLAQRLFHQKVFGEDHPYGYASSKEKYAVVEARDLAEYYERTASGGSFSYALTAGKIDAQTITQIQETIGTTQPQTNSAKPTPQPLNTKPGSYHQPRENAEQSSIRIGKPMISIGHPDHAELQVLNTAFGGYFGSRLMSNIREDKGYTYGIYSTLGAFQQTGYWLIGTEVGKSVSMDALTEIYKELKQLREEPIPENELQLVKNYIMGSYLSQVDGPFAQAKVHKRLINYNQSLENFQTRIEQVKSVTPKRLQELANRYFTTKDIVEVVVG